MAPRKPYTILIDGVPRDPHYDPEMFRSSINFPAGSEDLTLYAYPKSGSHWLLYITQSIISGGKGAQTYLEFLKNMRFLGGMDIKGWQPDIPLRLFSTHLPPRKDTMNKQAKYVYLARNPWDVCVSLFHMVKEFSAYRFQDGTFDEFFEDFFEGDAAGHGSYFDHVVAGYSLRNGPNFLFLTYEELLRDTRTTVVRLARFLGEKYAADMEADDSILQNVLDCCTADKLRRVLVLDTNIPTSELSAAESRCGGITFRDGYEGDPRKYSFVRKGIIGSWKGYFSPAQLRRMEARIQQVEKTSAVMDIWRDEREMARAVAELTKPQRAQED
ncbi:hypothetical protein HPB50_003055 [Hyalomma asiaticum]|uniref:Uncharacterized protein n=1 Tax=Hyalomma asiaticum TaxID=266040 RepID=A0ACB7SG81_HYAAI|nr:hypothetical protein HPB50_003055 [Hyalomma asiaticum]